MSAKGILQDSTAGEVTAVAEVRSSHHVLGVVHLLGQLGHGDGTEGVGATAGQRSESDHEEVKTGEWNHVDGQLAEIRVKLTRESQAGGDTGHDGGHEMVQVTVGWVGEFESPHADIVESLGKVRIQSGSRKAKFLSYLVIDTESLVGVLNELVDGEGGVVRLHDGVRDLGGWHDGESGHHAVGELLADLGNQQSTHTGTGSTTEGVGDLESLEAVATLGLTTDNVDDLVDQLGTLSVMALGPVVSSTGLPENEVVGTEELAKGARTDRVHGTGLEINEDGTGNILVSGGFVEVNIHALQLEVRSAIVAVYRVRVVRLVRIVYQINTYTPAPSRPCSPEMFCLYHTRLLDRVPQSYSSTGLDSSTYQNAAPI